jgi:competence protein ComEC
MAVEVLCICWVIGRLPFSVLAKSAVYGILVYTCQSNRQRWIWIVCILMSSVAQVSLVESIRVELDGALTGYVYQIEPSGYDLYIQRGDWKKVKVSTQDVSGLYEGAHVVIKVYQPMAFDRINQDGFRYDRYLLARGYHYGIRTRVTDIFIADDVGIRKPLLPELKLKLNKLLSSRADVLKPVSRQFYHLLLIGSVPENTGLRDAVSLIGLSHLFVISGFHFSLVVSAFKWLFTPILKKRYRVVVCLTLLLIVGYYLSIRWGQGAHRAMIMSLLPTFAFFIKRPLRGERSLLSAALITLVLFPHVLTQMGFQLSYIAAITMIVLVRSKGYAQIQTLTGRLIVASVVIGSMTMPFLSYHVRGVNLLMPLMAVLVTPLISMLLLLSLVWFIVTPFRVFDAPLSYLFEVLSKKVFEAIETLVYFGPLPFKLPYPLSLVGMIVVVVCLIVLMFPSIKRCLGNDDVQIRCKVMAICCLISALALLDRVDWGLSIRTYALGDGESYLIRAPRATVLYDVGNDVMLLEYLEMAGVVTIDQLIISHPHQDHDGILEDVLKRFKVKDVLLTISSPKEISVGALRLMIHQMENSQTVNDGSLVVYGHYQGLLPSERPFQFLLTGDLEEKGIKWLLETVEGPVDFLKMPHHGSYAQSYNQMLQHYRPQVAWISGGRGKRIKLERTVEELMKANIKFYGTMEHGELYLFEWSGLCHTKNFIKP